MSTTVVIAKRELSSFFYSPIAYVAITLFLLICGFLFRNDFVPGQPVSMRTLFEWMVWLLVFIVPILSMGLLAQEWASGTIETMMTAPVNETAVVLGKFFGALGFLVVLLAPTLVYLGMLAIYGRPDYATIFSGYLGVLLVAGLFMAVGIFCSSLTRSQVVSAVAAATILFVITILPWWIGSSTAIVGFWRNVIEQGVFNRYVDFSKGVIDTGNLIFFLVATAVFLFLTVKVLESRRWK
ncbi:MAG TPA: ABC transporter permease [Tepidisphaeraceae bacterium]|jgi:ABC-2 type transport system permease protein